MKSGTDPIFQRAENGVCPYFRGRIRYPPSEAFAMRHEVHIHADIPILEGVSRRQIEQAFAPLLEYLDPDGLGDVKSLEQDEPGFNFDAQELILYLPWLPQLLRTFPAPLH